MRFLYSILSSISGVLLVSGSLGVVDGVDVGVVVSEGVVVVVCVGSSLGFVVTSGSCVSFGLFSIIFSVFAGVDESQGESSRVKLGIMVNFLGTLISDVPLLLGSDGVLWLDDGEFLYL